MIEQMLNISLHILGAEDAADARAEAVHRVREGALLRAAEGHAHHRLRQVNLRRERKQSFHGWLIKYVCNQTKQVINTKEEHVESFSGS